jgi:hypothetical protein
MKIHLLDYLSSFLLKAPPYTSTFLRVQEWAEPVLVMRVEELERFRGTYRARVGFHSWQNEQGTWVIAVPFCLQLPPQLQIDGRPCLNPRIANDYEMIRRFTTAEGIRFLFLSADLADAEDAEIPWPIDQRTQVRSQLDRIDQALTTVKATSAFDADFDHARQEFQTLLETLENTGAWVAHHS